MSNCTFLPAQNKQNILNVFINSSVLNVFINLSVYAFSLFYLSSAITPNVTEMGYQCPRCFKNTQIKTSYIKWYKEYIGWNKKTEDTMKVQEWHVLISMEVRVLRENLKRENYIVLSIFISNIRSSMGGSKKMPVWKYST